MKLNLNLLKNKIRFYWEFRGWPKAAWTDKERIVIGLCHTSNEWAEDPAFYVLKYTCNDLVMFSRAQRAVKKLKNGFGVQNIQVEAWIDYAEAIEDPAWIMEQLEICEQYAPLTYDEMVELDWVKEFEGMRGCEVRIYADGDIYTTFYNKWSGDTCDANEAVSIEELLYNPGSYNVDVE